MVHDCTPGTQGFKSNRRRQKCAGFTHQRCQQRAQQGRHGDRAADEPAPRQGRVDQPRVDGHCRVSAADRVPAGRHIVTQKKPLLLWLITDKCLQMFVESQTPKVCQQSKCAQSSWHQPVRLGRVFCMHMLARLHAIAREHPLQASMRKRGVDLARMSKLRRRTAVASTVASLSKN